MAHHTGEAFLCRPPFEDGHPDVAGRDADEPESGRREQGGVLLGCALPSPWPYQHIQIRKLTVWVRIGRTELALDHQQRRPPPATAPEAAPMLAPCTAKANLCPKLDSCDWLAGPDNSWPARSKTCCHCSRIWSAELPGCIV